MRHAKGMALYGGVLIAVATVWFAMTGCTWFDTGKKPGRPAVLPPQLKVEFFVSAPGQSDIWRPGTANEIRWRQTSGPQRARVDIFLVEHPQPGEPQVLVAGALNNGAFTWNIPRHFEPGKYRVGVATPQRDGWGIGGPFVIYGIPQTDPTAQCTAGADTDDACQSCSNVADCEACGPKWVFSNGQCVQCPEGEVIPGPPTLTLKVANDYPENELGVTRACVHSTWDPSNPKGYGDIESGGWGICIHGPPWYYPDETYFLIWNIDWDENSCYNIRPLRVLELFEWTGETWVPKCICRSKVSCIDYQGYPVNRSNLHTVIGSDTTWCCRSGSYGSCDWEF